jgi:hypothetical protein
MKTLSSSSFVTLGTILLSSIAFAEKVVHVPTTKRNPDQAGIAKRGQRGILANEKTLYAANITVGTPGQPLLVDIDTGSGDLWIFDVKNPVCQSGGCFGGTCK